MQKAIEFAKRYAEITEDELELLLHCRKSLLFDGNTPWVKKTGTFDVTMGSYDGAEICELVGLYMLDLLSKKFSKEEIGLYRDDGLATFKGSGSASDRKRKEIIRIFKDEGLKIEIRCNLKRTDYLDVSFNLTDGTYRPFNKPNNIINYVHADSNHPPSVLKQIPKSISKRISNNSSSKEIFDESANIYNEALRKSGYTEKLEYCPDEVTDESRNRRRKNRSRNIIWFNPPYSKDVETNVAKIILNLVSKHFPRNHPYRKIFNRNNVKVSYGCLPNMKSVITSHNKKITREDDENKRTCNCPRIVRDKCPMDGQCLSQKIVYNAEVSTDDGNSRKNYIGTSKGPMKHRISVHKKSFFNKEYNPTSLSNYIWNLKKKKKGYDIKWSILKRTSGYHSVSKSCSLCLTEKFLIAKYPNEESLINERNELVSKCRHDRDHVLECYK